MIIALVRIVIAASVLSWAASFARGTLMVPLSISELAAESDLVVYGKVVSINTRLEPDRRIATRVLLSITETWKGEYGDSRLEVVIAGGTLGVRQVIVDGQPDYQPGEEVVLFLKFNQRRETVTVGLSQGKFLVFTNPATGQKEAHNPFHGRSASGAKGTDGQYSQENPAKALPLAELKRIVQDQH